MRKSHLLSIALFGYMILVSTNTVVAGISSTFDTDDEGWSASEVFDDASTGGQWGVSWTSTGGLPAGAVYRDDVGSGATVFSAPTKFLGDKSAYLDGTISFDMRNNVANAGGEQRWNLMLIGGGIKIVHHDYVLDTPNQWGHFTALLNEANWTQCLSSSDWSGPITNADFSAVLENLEGMYISADRGWGSDRSVLDNVVMIPEPATLFLLAVGSLAQLRKRK